MVGQSGEIVAEGVARRTPVYPIKLRPASRYFRSLLAIAPLFLTAWPAHAQWLTRPAPWKQPAYYLGIDVQAFAALETNAARTLFALGSAGNDSALVRSDDDGRNWQVVPVRGATNPLILWLGTIPTTQGTASRHGAVFATLAHLDSFYTNFRCDLLRSDDGGIGWDIVALSTYACVLAFDPSSARFVYGIATGYPADSNSQIWRSGDGGATWTSVSSARFDPVRAIRVGTDGTVYAVTDADVRVSHDHGDTWSPAFSWPTNSLTGERVLTKDVATFRHPVFGDRFALAATTDGLYQSMDAGQSWTAAGLQGFQVDYLDVAGVGSDGVPQILIGYRNGLALLREGAIVPLANGLPSSPVTLPKGGGRYVLSAAGLSICNDLASCIGGALPYTGTLVEYHNALLDHYFMTLDGPEARGIDLGAAGPGWTRTGAAYQVFADGTAAPFQFQGVCRFYGTPRIGPNSHFYTIDPRECSDVQADPGWTLESAGAFVAQEPLTRSGSGPYERYCASGRTLYRLYNNRFAQNDSNHWYVADLALYQSMQAQGWKGEGPQLCVLR